MSHPPAADVLAECRRVLEPFARDYVRQAADERTTMTLTLDDLYRASALLARLSAAPPTAEAAHDEPLISASKVAREFFGYKGLPTGRLPEPQQAAPKAVWTHVKRGTSYHIVGHAKVQASKPIVEDDELVVYRSIHDRAHCWARPVSEFYDGRFTVEPPQPAAPPQATDAARVERLVPSIDDIAVEAALFLPDGETISHAQERNLFRLGADWAVSQVKARAALAAARPSEAHLLQIIAEARQLLADGEHEDALETLTVVEGEPPELPVSRYERGIIQRERDEARDDYGRVSNKFDECRAALARRYERDTGKNAFDCPDDKLWHAWLIEQSDASEAQLAAERERADRAETSLEMLRAGMDDALQSAATLRSQRDAALKALDTLFTWYDLDGSVGGASRAFEEVRAALPLPVQAGGAGRWRVI